MDPLPRIAGREPVTADLPAGDYWWCACGLSKKQPFCDGSHKASAMTPIKFTVDARKAGRTVWLCTCKHAKTKPFCDGTHNKLPP